GVLLLPPFFFSTPAAVGARIVKWFVEGTIWWHLGITLLEAVLAFVIGAVAGVLVGFALSARAAGRRRVRSLRQNAQRAAARGAGADLCAVVRPRHLVESRARHHACVLHRVLQCLPGHQGSQPLNSCQRPDARHDRTATGPARLLALG